MRRVTFPEVGLTTSALGYGCASLMAKTGRAESLRLLEQAFEAGITHYDVARLYGYGEAESALGDFLAGRRRGEVTVTTKLGIDPPTASRGLAFAKGAARRAARVVTPLRRVARRQAERLVKSGRFGVAEARASLETSLRELRTEYVDLLLLHECQPEDLSRDLFMFLQACVEKGSIRSFGTATSPAATAAILEGPREFTPVVQVASSIAAPAFGAIPELTNKAVITHSALGATLDDVHRHVMGSAERARTWSEAVGADCSQRRVLGQLLLAWASLANPRGIVVFSSRDPATIRANAELSPSVVGSEQISRFEAVARRELTPRT